ncbi:uncharacterized protein LOC113146946 [Cyclospora cayetanensis]|uniref:Uncharacterized protein LOC113146946 n=1 Tax=Cyclospora cayetanensis TaxID=88456 RepID=A0A6P6RUS4_9EIME|nr:uncharacterized protein LOC113146946 [Cyclospora cayetanensis]
MHEEFEEAINEVFDSPSDVIVVTKPGGTVAVPGTSNPASGTTLQNVGASPKTKLWAFAPVRPKYPSKPTVSNSSVNVLFIPPLGTGESCPLEKEGKRSSQSVMTSNLAKAYAESQ